MIENPSKEDLVNLIEKESGRCVSVLMRTHQSGRGTTQNPIRFKNLINEAIQRVGDHQSIRDRLERLAKLEHDVQFWQHQCAGFALFVCEDFEQHFKLSHSPDDSVYVGDHFLTRPLAGASCGGDSTRVLALSWDRARWFACDGQEAHEIENESFPVMMDELVIERDAEGQLQFTTHGTMGGGNAGPHGRSTAMYHGHGEGEDKIEADRDQYLSRVGKLVAGALYNTDLTLLVMATDEVAGHFTSTNNLEVADVIQASPDGFRDEKIKDKIIQASRDVMQRSEKDLTQRLGTALAGGAASSNIKEILQEAANGRVETLLLGNTEPIRGSFDRENRQVSVDSSGETDLVNLAVRETLQAGGSVSRLPEGEFDDGIAAIYRF